MLCDCCRNHVTPCDEAFCTRPCQWTENAKITATLFTIKAKQRPIVFWENTAIFLWCKYKTSSYNTSNWLKKLVKCVKLNISNKISSSNGWPGENNKRWMKLTTLICCSWQSAIISSIFLKWSKTPRSPPQHCSIQANVASVATWYKLTNVATV